MNQMSLYVIAFALSFLPHSIFSKTNTHVQEKPIVILVASYNNAKWCHMNMSSILTQQYTNYRVIYIDDNSTDDTYEQVKTLIKEYGQEDRVQLIRNEKNQGALANFYYAIHSCHDYEIIAHVDGDDCLPHPFVLQRINQEYQNDNVWLTYGQYINYPYGNKGFCEKIPDKYFQKNSFRSMNFLPVSHLKTYYAGLFKQIALNDLLYESEFFSMASDVAILFPLLEMCGDHVSFIPDILYVYNHVNPISDHAKNVDLQKKLAAFIYQKKPYTKLKGTRLKAFMRSIHPK